MTDPQRKDIHHQLQLHRHEFERVEPSEPADLLSRCRQHGAREQLGIHQREFVLHVDRDRRGPCRRAFNSVPAATSTVGSRVPAHTHTRSRHKTTAMQATWRHENIQLSSQPLASRLPSAHVSSACGRRHPVQLPVQGDRRNCTLYLRHAPAVSASARPHVEFDRPSVRHTDQPGRIRFLCGRD